MTAASRRGVRAEERAAAALGTRRVHCARGESAPDLAPVRTSTGVMLGAEVKHRARLPALVTGALEQARGYFGARAVPVAILFQKGAHGGIACIDLDAFARLVGLDVAALPAERKTKRAPAQLDLLDVHPKAEGEGSR